MARGSRGNEFDTRDIVVEVLKLRSERAALLGYETHAAFALDNQTAKTVDAVNDILGRLAPRAYANARNEAADLQALINETEDEPFELASWDWLYYTEKLRKERYDLDASKLKPYFELNRVLEDGVFFMAENLYGLTFEERPELPVYNEDVRVFEAFLDGEAIGLFLFDPGKVIPRNLHAGKFALFQASQQFGYGRLAHISRSPSVPGTVRLPPGALWPGRPRAGCLP